MAPWAGAAALATVYVLTMCRDLYWYDSAELALAAVQPGLSHPPGQPLHTLAGWLAAHLVPGHPLFGVNLLSALCAAATVVPATAIALRLGPRTPGRGAWLAAAVLVGLGFDEAVWDSATRVEVYAPAALLALTHAAHLMGVLDRLAGRSPSLSTRGPDPFTSPWWRLSRRLPWADWLLSGLLLGATFSLHPYIAVFAAVGSLAACAGPLLRTRPARPSLSGAMFALGGLLGLLPYAWLPISGALDGHLVWGDPSSLERLLFYLTGMDYAHNRAGALSTLAHVLHFLGWLARRGLLPILLGGAIAWWLGRRDPPGAGMRAVPLVFLCLGLLVIGRIGNYRPEIPDFLGYLLPATWLMGAGLAAAAVRAYLVLPSRAGRMLVAGIIVCWVALNAFASPSLVERSRAGNAVARRLAEGVLMDAPRDAVVLVSSDHVVFPLLYLVEVERLREDVVVLSHGWASSSWYWRHLLERDPTLAPPDPATPDRDRRIRSFLAANPDRAVVAESLHLASLSDAPITRSGWTLRTGAGAAEIDARAGVVRHAWARVRLSRWMERHGAPGTQDRRILAWIAARWGHDERAGGRAGQAVLDYLSGSPPGPAAEVALPPDLLDPHRWRRPVPPPPPPHRYRLLSSPELDLFYAGELLTRHAGCREVGLRLVAEAASLGCVEARRWLEGREQPVGREGDDGT
jgi:hypothetical protein